MLVLVATDNRTGASYRRQGARNCSSRLHCAMGSETTSGDDALGYLSFVSVDGNGIVAMSLEELLQSRRLALVKREN